MTHTRQPMVMTVLSGMVMTFFITSVMSAIPGPKDPRYPDEIVMPKVKCDSEGVFPHPRNCSWYYRCVDRMNVGYFWTYHFECEPGTVFSDELDQCIFPFLISPPCGTAGSASPAPVTSATLPATQATPATQPATQATPATQPATQATPATQPATPVPQTPTSTATPTQKPDNSTHGPLVPEPEPITPDPTIPAAETITVTETEPPATESPITIPVENPTTEKEAEPTTTVSVEPETTMATLIEEDPTTTSATIAQPETTEQPLSTPPATAQPDTPEPTTEPGTDFPSEVPTVTQPATTVFTFEDTTTLEPTTVSSTNVGIFSCTFRPEDCVTHGPCPPDTITRTLCTGCYIIGTFVEASNLCNQVQGKLYDKDNGVCITDPALNPDCFPTTTTTAPEPTTTAPLITVAITTEFDLTCSAEETRPQADWVLNRYCQYYYLCTNDGLFTGAVRLCENYYQCYLGPDNRWATELMSCPEGQLFTYDEDKCVNAPSEREICAFRVRQG